MPYTKQLVNQSERIGGIFVNYMSCTEDGFYSERSSELAALVAESDDENIRRALSLFENEFGIRWQSEITEPTLINEREVERLRIGRLAQQILYGGIARLLLNKEKIEILSAYSLGYISAFFSASTIDEEQMICSISKANRPYTLDNLQTYQSGSYWSLLLQDVGNKDFYDRIRTLLVQAFSDVLVKDDRRPYAVHVVGSWSDLNDLKAQVFNEFPSAETGSGKVIKSDAAHLFPEKFRDIGEKFSSNLYSPPAVPIILHSGKTLHKGSHTREIAEGISTSLHAPLNMSLIRDTWLETQRPTLLIGSRKANRFVTRGLAVSDIESHILIDWETASLAILG